MPIVKNYLFYAVCAVHSAKKINKSMKQLNERKLIRQDLDRIARSMREELPAKNKAELGSAFDELKSKAKNVSGDNLSDWDKESLRLATEYVRDENKEEFLKTINRILELAGLSPEMEKEIFQRQQILQKEIENKND